MWYYQQTKLRWLFLHQQTKLRWLLTHTSTSNLSKRSVDESSATFNSAFISTLGDWGTADSSSDVPCISPSHSSSTDEGSAAISLSSVRYFLMFSLSLSEALNSPSFFFGALEPLEVFRLTVVRRDDPLCGLCERIRSSPASVKLQRGTSSDIKPYFAIPKLPPNQRKLWNNS